jgi:hypothetical protein
VDAVDHFSGEVALDGQRGGIREGGLGRGGGREDKGCHSGAKKRFCETNPTKSHEISGLPFLAIPTGAHASHLLAHRRGLDANSVRQRHGGFDAGAARGWRWAAHYFHDKGDLAGGWRVGREVVENTGQIAQAAP